MTFLLDVNVLIALIDTKHSHHDVAHDWFEQEGMLDWATCPLTENGLVRIVGRTTYPNFLGAPGAVVELLRSFARVGNWTFWADDVSLLDKALIAAERLSAPGQITDSYLLALAVWRGGMLATLDRRLVTNAVEGGDKALRLIA